MADAGERAAIDPGAVVSPDTDPRPEPVSRGPVRDRGLPPSPNGASSFHIWWDLPDVPLTAVSVVLEVLAPPEVDRLAFFALQASFVSPDGQCGGAHTGLQWNPRHPRNRAVNWGGYDRRGAVLEGAGSQLPSAPDDPNTRDFAWEPGARYRLTIGPRTSGAEGAPRWPARVEGLDTGEDLVVRELVCEGTLLGAPVVWSELFTRCDDPSIEVRWSAARAVSLDGSILRVDRGRVTYQAHHAGGCTNTDVHSDGIGVVQRSAVSRRTPHEATIPWRT